MSGQVQLLSKSLFGAVMFGLAFYYARIPLYPWFKAMDEQWRPISIGCLSCGSLIVLVALKQGSKATAKKLLLAGSLALGLGVFSSTQWFFQAQSISSRSKLVWLTSEKAAFSAAKNETGGLLIDMWAEWCEACKKMEASTFSDPTVIETLNKQGWTLLKFDLTRPDEGTDDIRDRYKVQSLPTLILIPNPRKAPKKREQLRGYVSAQVLLRKIEELKKEN